MISAAVSTAHRSEGTFRHEAFIYAGQEQFLDGMTSFIRAGMEADEPVLVVVGASKIALLRAELRSDAENACFADMSEVGSNPARIIPAWRDFVAEHGPPGRGLRGIGEPIGPDRGPAELVECQRHETLLNLAFADTPSFWLICPYDRDALGPAVLEEAHRSHPFVMEDGTQVESDRYAGTEAAAAPFEAPLPEPSSRPHELAFQADSVAGLRSFVSLHAADAGIGVARTKDLVLAASEVAVNSVIHADGGGRLRLWQDGETLICEIHDGGRIDDALAGRERPDPERVGGYGLWLANHLCDLVQLRSFTTGNVVRLHMRQG